MSEKHGIIRQTKLQFPARELLVVPHEGQDLTVSFPAFEAYSYKENLGKMQENYSHPVTGEQMSFRPATTSESISAVAYDFETDREADAKKSIFDSGWLQLGYIIRTSDGVFTNTQITDESQLRLLLDNAQKVNEIYLLDNGVGFAPYETFEKGVQDANTFAHGGLARVLEHTTEKEARNLRKIASHESYKGGVDVWGFDSFKEDGFKEPIISVAGLDSDRDPVGDRLDVGDIIWNGGRNGYAFGVSK